MWNLIWLFFSPNAFEIATLAVALASLVVSIVACLIAANSLSAARKVAERDETDWRQRKWFDLYFMATEASHAFEAFQAKFGGIQPRYWGFAETESWNELMLLFRKLSSVAMVFPKSPEIDQFIKSTEVFKDRTQAMLKHSLVTVNDAVEGLRRRALVHPSVLK